MNTLVPLVDIAAYLDRFLRVTPEDDVEGNGLVHSAGRAVAKVGAAVNTSFEAIERAAEEGVDLLLVHHTSWREIDLSLRDRKFARLRERGLSLYAAHKSLDRAPDIGPAGTLAGLLGMRVEQHIVGGSIAIGTFADATLDALVARAEQALGGRVTVRAHSTRFGRGAIAPGGAGYTSYLEEARSLGCDTYVTGEGSMFTELFAREAGLNLILGGHYRTELPAIQALTRHVAERFALPWVTVPERVEG